VVKPLLLIDQSTWCFGGGHLEAGVDTDAEFQALMPWQLAIIAVEYYFLETHDDFRNDASSGPFQLSNS